MSRPPKVNIYDILLAESTILRQKPDTLMNQDYVDQWATPVGRGNAALAAKSYAKIDEYIMKTHNINLGPLPRCIANEEADNLVKAFFLVWAASHDFVYDPQLRALIKENLNKRVPQQGNEVIFQCMSRLHDRYSPYIDDISNFIKMKSTNLDELSRAMSEMGLESTLVKVGSLERKRLPRLQEARKEKREQLMEKIHEQRFAKESAKFNPRGFRGTSAERPQLRLGLGQPSSSQFPPPPSDQ